MNSIQTNVLIIDSIEEGISLKSIVDDTELKIYEARSSKMAFKELYNQSIHLIIIDYEFFENDILEFMSTLRANERLKEIPVLFVIPSDGVGQYLITQEDMGIIDYIYKPVYTTFLLAKLKFFKKINESKERLKIEKEQLENQKRELKALSHYDGLTQIYNRRYFDEQYLDVWETMISKKSPVSLIMFDIDNFKAYNDTYGHLMGDDCLKQIAKAVDQELEKPEHIVCRYGGEEFIILLPNTDQKEMAIIGESIRHKIEELNIPHKTSKVASVVTVSLGGITKQPKAQEDPLALVNKADELMYKAKENGKNQLMVLTID